VLPEGLLFQSEFVSEVEERDLLAAIEQIEFRQIRMHGLVARRASAHFGLDYDYERFKLTPAEPQPPALDPLRARSAALVGLHPEELEDPRTAIPTGRLDRLASGCSGVWGRDRHLAAVLLPDAVSARLGPGAPAGGFGPSSSLGLRARWLRPNGLAAQHSADAGAPLLDHIPDSEKARTLSRSSQGTIRCA